jgi:hypothetical protein
MGLSVTTKNQLRLPGLFLWWHKEDGATTRAWPGFFPNGILPRSIASLTVIFQAMNWNLMSLAHAMVDVHGPEDGLLKAVLGIVHPSLDRLELIGMVLRIDEVAACNWQQDSMALVGAAKLGHMAITKLLLRGGGRADCQKGLALVWAAHGGHDAVVRLLLDRGVRADSRNWLALIKATKGKHKATVRLLLERGVRADDRSTDMRTRLAKVLAEMHGRHAHAYVERGR